MASALNVSPLDFFRAIWGDTPGWAELTTIAKSGVKSWPFHAPEGIPLILPAATNHNRQANVYMGVLLRREKWPRPTGKVDPDGKPVMEYRGTEANAQSSWCVWAEFDFAGQGHKGKTIPEAVARKALKEFPFIPSIIVKSGGGIQVYWLLKEVAEGNDLWRVKAVNKALVTFFNADPQSVDLARILRIPSLLNMKYDPPRRVEISWWKPDGRYTLDDFEDLLPVEKILPASSGTPGQPVAKSPRPAPSVELSEESIAELALALSNLWKHGYRHKSEQDVGGMFAWAGILEANAKAIIEAASNSVGGDSADRVKGVEGTYRKYLRGDPITGRRHFEEMAKAMDYPAQQDAAYFLETFQKILAKTPRREEPAKAPATPEESPVVSALAISDYGKKIICDGYEAYLDFLKNTETPAKIRQLKADGKMTRTEADCYIATLLLQATVSEQIISAIFKDKTNKISEKAHEKEEKIDEYVGSVIRECQTALRAQPKWQATSVARAAAAKVDRAFEDEHFRVKRVLRFIQEPPTYDVTLILEGIEYTLKCSLDQVWKYEYFSKAFFSKFNRHLPFQKDSTWNRMYAAAEHETIQVEKEEGTFEGQMDIILNLLEETAVDSKSADISINHSAVRTKDGQTVFKTPIIMRMLKDRFSDAKKQDVIHYLKNTGWDYIQKRLGKRNDWIWLKTSSNGNGHGPTNGQPPKAPKSPPNAPETPKTTPKPSEPVPASPVDSDPPSDMLFELDLPPMREDGVQDEKIGDQGGL